ncbi:hypothetical protein N0V93_004324 [Gnomoniopsis smithogilvyi]|uniref:RING-type E3 ubiquitin transferase n=1 Tax=Gnomoniopsis smithogilvyi TaxID=1191159 RepID=A0A9W9CX34_9PEZI|nr:hypothetical protein N0V93_004324 [Gnomoniopsis smithogilvyi]
MSSFPYSDRGSSGPQHLDLTGDREVVFCHNCSNEWYNDEHGLECPRCHGEICEIITPENDPRDIRPNIQYSQPNDHARDHGYDHPDPDEDDIGDGNAFLPPGFLPPPNMNRNRQAGGPVDPSSDQEVFQRFQETLNMLMGFNNPAGQPGRANRETVFGGSSPFGGPGITGTTQTRIFRGPGRATFSITTNFPGTGGQTGDRMQMGHDANHNQNDDFDMYGPSPPQRIPHRMPELTLVAVRTPTADRRSRIFGNAMGSGNVRSPQVQFGQAPLEGGLHNLLSLVFPGLGGPNAVHGDAVYSQEALDRIITQLMEAHPQSNAAPPATEDAIEKLEKKKLDREMMGEGDKAECTICIDEMNIGDEVTVLPCKHWFHGECVVLWLKEHNTCPICRTPIEKREGNAANGDPGSSADNQRRASGGGLAGGSRFGGWFGAGSGSNNNPWATRESDSLGSNSAGSHQHRGARSPEERQARLNAIRNLADPSSYGQPAPDSPRDRRDSWSPTSPPPGSSSTRERSPARPRPDRTNSSSWNSQRSGRSNHNTGGSGGGSSNPINWLRDRFSGSGSGSNNSSNSSSSNNNNNTHAYNRPGWRRT